MLLYVLDKSFKVLNLIHSYAMAQYTLELNGSGSFEVDLPLTEETKEIFTSGQYILFEKDVLGIITGIDSESELKLTGFLSNWFLSYRCIRVTTDKSGTVTNVCRALVNENFISPSDSTRKISKIRLSSESEYNPSSPVISTQYTGNSVEENLKSTLEPYEMGYSLTPVLGAVYDTSGELISNISSFDFRVIKGLDRTIENTEGNTKVVFSFDLRNLLSGEYIKSINDYKNVAYVAGAGEGKDRVVYETGSTSSSGFDRVELYVDARDLTDQDSKGNSLTDAQYKMLLKERGAQKLAEAIKSETFSATIDTQMSQYDYGTDFKLGDKINVYDNRIGVLVAATITSVTLTSMGTTNLLDIEFGYQKLTSIQKLKRGGVL